jgi:acyl-coenzyme A thioesterase PaaI-like protein
MGRRLMITPADIQRVVAAAAETERRFLEAKAAFDHASAACAEMAAALAALSKTPTGALPAKIEGAH